MSIIKHVTLQKIVAHDFRYVPRKIVSWLYFRRSDMDPILCTFHCFRILAALSNDLATLGLKWVTQSAPRHCLSLLAVHQKSESV